MKSVARIKWLSSFDMEPLISAILQNGMLLSAGLVAASLVIDKVGRQRQVAEHVIQAVSIPVLISADLHRFWSPDFWSRLLMDSGVAVLLITPYVQLCVTTLYFTLVESRWTYALYAGITLAVLTAILFTTLI